ncbi:MAG: M12 family metallo-peptidase, partial [Saprospiraceae bacterium]
MKHFLWMAMAMMTFICTAQNIRPIDLLRKAHSGVAIKSVSVFKTVSERNQIVLPDELKEGEIMVVDRNQLKQVLEDDASFLQIEVPTGDKNIVLELVEVNPLAGDAIIRVAPSMQIIEMPLAKHFRGIIQGDQSSLVALSIFDDEVMGFVSSSTFSGNMVIGKLENTQYHIAYEDQTIQDLNSFECKTEDINLEYTTEQLRDEDSKRDLSDCVRLYLEVNNDIYNNKGSTAATTNYITGLFNQVATLYANEQINVNISEILIWTTQSPYTSTTSSGILNQFTGYRQGFNGDLAQLLSYQASGGIAYLDGLCRTNPDFSMSYAGISSSYQNVPTYSWSVMVCTHEFGHLMGSNHTHACAWNGNSTAIDGCYTTEGGCSNPGVPQGGGTIMSYCHLTSAGINFNLGFGPQPGSVIRYEVTNASCLQACPGGATCSDGIQNGNETGVDCGGS